MIDDPDEIKEAETYETENETEIESGDENVERESGKEKSVR